MDSIRVLASKFGRSVARAFTVLAILLLFSVPPAGAATWIASGGGYWFAPGNWSPADVPDVAGEVAVFDADGQGYPVLLDGNPNIDRLFVYNPGVTLYLGGAHLNTFLAGGFLNHGTVRSTSAWILGDFQNLSDGKVILDGGQTLYFIANHVSNDGEIRVNADGTSDNSAVALNQAVTLDGTGVLRLSATSEMDDAQISSIGWGDLRHGGSHVIRGAGRILTLMTNDATIIADVPGKALVFTDESKVNNALMTAVNGGVLDIACPFAQGAAGAIRADGGRVTLRHTLNGGTLAALNGGVVTCQTGAKIQGISIDGTVELPSGQSMWVLPSTITNNGTITVNSDEQAASSWLALNADVYFAGTGVIRLQGSGNVDAAQISSVGWARLHNESSHSIRGDGRIIPLLSNNGTIVADVPGRTLAFTDEAKTNSALISAVDGGILSFACPVTQEGNGWITADGGSAIVGSSLSGGTVAGRDGGAVSCLSSARVQAIRNAGRFDIASGQAPWFLSSTITNDGTITINSDLQGAVAALVLSGNVDFTGAGEVRLQTAGNPDQAQIAMTGWGQFHNAGSHRLRGEGRIPAPLVNDATVTADVTGRSLRLTDEVKTNNGTMSAQGGGTLDLECTINQGIGGTLHADGGNVLLRVSVIGGSLSSANGGAVICAGAPQLRDVANLGRLDIPSGQTLAVFPSTLNDDGTITVNSDSGGAQGALRFNSSVTMQGTGSVVLQGGGSPDGAIIGTHYSGYLTQAAGHTIRGEGSIQIGLSNLGLVTADVNGRALVLNWEGKYNQGTLRGENGGILRTECALNNMGTVEVLSGGTFRSGPLPVNYSNNTLTGGSWRASANSALRLPGAQIHTVAADVLLDGEASQFYSDDSSTEALADWRVIAPAGSVEIRNGRNLSASGDLDNSGILAAGRASRLTVGGGYTQGAAAGLRVVFEQADLSGAAKVSITGDASVDGRCDVSFSGYTPLPGDTFTVLTAAHRLGQFATVAFADTTLNLEVLHTPTQVLITCSQPPSAISPPVVTEPVREFRLFAPPVAAGHLSLAVDVPRSGVVDLEILDVAGRHLATLWSGELPAGHHLFAWDGQSRSGGRAASGIFFARTSWRTEGRTLVRSGRVVWVRT